MASQPRRQNVAYWVPLGLAAFMIAGLFLIPTAFFLIHIEYDPLRYFLMSRHIAMDGSPHIGVAVNEPPIAYASGMAYVYAPIMMVFDNFAAQLRAIQVLNVALLCAFVVLAIRYFKAALTGINQTTLAMLFGTAILIDTRWQQAASNLNADLLPAVLTVASCLIAGAKDIAWKRKFYFLCAIGFLGFFVKISLLVIPLVFLAVESGVSVERKVIAAVLYTMVAAILIACDWQTVFFYLRTFEPDSAYALVGTSAARIFSHVRLGLENLFFAALPSMIVPNLRYVFIDDFRYTITTFAPEHVSLRLLCGIATGLAVSFCILLGARRLWRSRPFDICLLLVFTPVFSLVPDSTDRYLLGFMPTIWVCLAIALLPLWNSLRPYRALVVTAAALGVLFLAFVEAKSLSLRARTPSSVDAMRAFGFVNRVSAVYGETLDQLKALSPQKPSLLYVSIDMCQLSCGAWGAATNLPVYALDAGPPPARGRILVVLSCRGPDCDTLPAGEALMRQRLAKFCREARILWYRRNDLAQAKIYEVRLLPGCRIADVRQVPNAGQG